MTALTKLLAAIVSGVAALFAGLWARQKVKTIRMERDQARAEKEAINQAMKRLDAARRTPATPIDAKKRTDFERTP